MSAEFGVDWRSAIGPTAQAPPIPPLVSVHRRHPMWPATQVLGPRVGLGMTH